MLEIGWRCRDSPAKVGRNAHGDHVPGNLVAHAHAGVEALGDDVDQAVADIDFELHVRVLRQRFRKLEPKHGRRGTGKRYSAQMMKTVDL